MLKIERFINELMSSNCFIVYDEVTKHGVVVDPGSEKSEREQCFIKEKDLVIDYIILTHEHTDHTWGVNALIDCFDTKVVCSRACGENVIKESSTYFKFYYDNPAYHYEVKRIDIIVEDVNDVLKWNDHTIRFIHTPGHSVGAVCFAVGAYLFTGDTLMEYKPYIPKRNGSREQYVRSLEVIQKMYAGQSWIVCPGHGELTTVERCFIYNKQYCR